MGPRVVPLQFAIRCQPLDRGSQIQWCGTISQCPQCPNFMFWENGGFTAIKGTHIAHLDVSRPPCSIPLPPEKSCDNTTYHPPSPPLTSSGDVMSTSAPHHFCHLSARSLATSPFVPRYMTKNLRHDDIITKSAKKPIKPNFVKKACKFGCFLPSLLRYFTKLLHAYDDEIASQPSICHLDHYSSAPHSVSRLPTSK